MERLAFDHGESYDSYLSLDEGREYFFGSRQSGVVSFVRWRRHAYVVGGLLTPRENRRRLLREFLDFAESERLQPLFFGVLGADLPLFQEQSLHISKIGEEPIIDLQATTWRGQQFAWVRRQENSCLKNGVVVDELEPHASCPVFRDSVAPELLEVSKKHLQDTVFGRELALMVGRFRPLQMHRKRLFVAKRDGRIEAFVVATPAYGGQYWAVETYRRRPDAVRGVIACMIVQIARQLREEGAQVLSLCQIPGLRCDQTNYSDSRLVRNGLTMWWNRVSWVYDPSRQYHFKSRFRPDYREMYIAGVKPRFLPMLAFALKWGVIWPDFRRVPKQMLRRMKKWGHTEQLADPREEQFAIIDRLCLDEPTAPEVLEESPICAETSVDYQMTGV